MKAVVTVMPKQSVLDPQGAAVAQAMRHHGLEGVGKVRVGKSIEIELLGGEGPLPPLQLSDEAALHGLCRDLLSNPVIEDYTLELRD